MEENIVAYGPVSSQRLGKHVPVARQQVHNNATVGRNNRRSVFSMCSVPRKEGHSSVEFCTGGCEDRTSTCKAEESPLLEAVARERLMKTQQTGKGLTGAVVICELWRLAVTL
jgi:hypothetical protein